MSAHEFGEWMVMFRAEQLHPAAGRLRHAQSMAALSNGPMQRKDKKPFMASDFMPSDAWASQIAAPPAVSSPSEVARQVVAINALLKGGRK